MDVDPAILGVKELGMECYRSAYRVLCDLNETGMLTDEEESRFYTDIEEFRRRLAHALRALRNARRIVNVRLEEEEEVGNSAP